MTLERDIITLFLIGIAIIIIAYFTGFPRTLLAYQSYRPVSMVNYNQPATVFKAIPVAPSTTTTYQYQQVPAATNSTYYQYQYTQPSSTTYTTTNGVVTQ